MAKRILTAVIWLPIAALGFAFAPVWAIKFLHICDDGADIPPVLHPDLLF